MLEKFEEVVDVILADPVEVMLKWVVKWLALRVLRHLIVKTWNWWKRREKDPSSKEE